MREALLEALRAYRNKEVPIGAVIVKDSVVLSKAHNLRIRNSDPTAHAEIIAIRIASKRIGDWRLSGATLYVTAEPCLMCLGAIIHSRITRLVYATKEFKMGAVESLYTGLINNVKNHHMVEYLAGVKEKTASGLLSRFFREIRRKT